MKNLRNRTKIIILVFFLSVIFIVDEPVNASISCPRGNGVLLSGSTCSYAATLSGGINFNKPLYRDMPGTPGGCSVTGAGYLTLNNYGNCGIFGYASSESFSGAKTLYRDIPGVPGGCSVSGAGYLTLNDYGNCGVSGYLAPSAGVYGGTYSCLTPSDTLTGNTCSYPAVADGVCGTANNQVTVSAPTENFCGDPTSFSGFSGTNPWTWSCLGKNGGSAATCGTFSSTQASGVCGASHGQALTTAPATNLCQVTNSPTTVLGTGPWNWSCTGANGGTNAACSASKFTPPACSSVNGNSYSAADFDQYKFYGDPNGDGTINISDAIAVMSNSSLCTPAKCDVDGNGLINITDALAIMRMANGTQTTRLCDSGMQTNLTGSGPWNWKCGNIDCSAQLPPVIPPVCTPNYTCTLQPTGNVCDASNVGQTIITQTDQCNDTNACSTPTKQTCIANGVSCNHPDETITCPALREGTDWKEVSP